MRPGCDGVNNYERTPFVSRNYNNLIYIDEANIYRLLRFADMARPQWLFEYSTIIAASLSFPAQVLTNWWRAGNFDLAGLRTEIQRKCTARPVIIISIVAHAGHDVNDLCRKSIDINIIVEWSECKLRGRAEIQQLNKHKFARHIQDLLIQRRRESLLIIMVKLTMRCVS